MGEPLFVTVTCNWIISFTSSHLDSAARDEYIFFIYVKVDVWDGGEVGRAPFVEVSDELEGEVGQLAAVCGQDEGAGGRQPQRCPVKCLKDSSAWCHAVLRAPREAATHSIPQSALLLRLTAPRVALDQVSSDALATFGAVAVPEQLLGLEYLG